MKEERPRWTGADFRRAAPGILVGFEVGRGGLKEGALRLLGTVEDLGAILVGGKSGRIERKSRSESGKDGGGAESLAESTYVKAFRNWTPGFAR